MKNILYNVFLLLLCLSLSSWGSKGHRKISQNFAAGLPTQMAFLKPAWTNFIATHASDADNRKSQDPNESPRHYIDINNYPVFLQTGRIPQTYDSIVEQFGSSFVIDQGILPWATLITFDSLKSCFLRRDWSRSAYFAADLGHYIGDGHMPLHITNNYNGQMTGQTGIHSRYETSLVSRYETQILYPADSIQFIENVGEYVFSYLYEDFRYVDSVLLADSYAKNLAGGSTTSDAYYQALWEKSGDFTIRLMRNGSGTLANLIYTAWVQAGSPMIYPNAIEDKENTNQQQLLQVFPNPVSKSICFPFVVSDNSETVSLMIYDSSGNLQDTVISGFMSVGYHEVNKDVQGLAAGVYFCVFKVGDFSESQRFVVTHCN